MKVAEVFNSMGASPRELVSKKFWTSFELSALDRLLPRYHKFTFLVRLLVATCFPVAFYFFVSDLSRAGVLRSGIASYVSVGTFIVFMVVLFNYENQKRIQGKVYT